MKVSFFRNVPNYKSLLSLSVEYIGIVAEYISIATVHLSDEDFIAFCSDFQKSYDYLIPYVDTSVIRNGTWRCVSIVGKNATVLVVMEHYQYPRYVASASQQDRNLDLLF